MREAKIKGYVPVQKFREKVDHKTGKVIRIPIPKRKNMDNIPQIQLVPEHLKWVDKAKYSVSTLIQQKNRMSSVMVRGEPVWSPRYKPTGIKFHTKSSVVNKGYEDLKELDNIVVRALRIKHYIDKSTEEDTKEFIATIYSNGVGLIQTETWTNRFLYYTDIEWYKTTHKVAEFRQIKLWKSATSGTGYIRIISRMDKIDRVRDADRIMKAKVKNDKADRFDVDKYDDVLSRLPVMIEVIFKLSDICINKTQ